MTDKKPYNKPELRKPKTPQERYLLKRTFQKIRNAIRVGGKRNGKS